MIWLLANTTFVFSQETRYVNYTVEDGLPSAEVYFAQEDINGYMWFGTDRGLCRYDGYKFTTFTSENSALTSNTIFKCYEAPNHDLWFTCYDGSIVVYDIDVGKLIQSPLTEHLQSIRWWTKRLEFRGDFIYVHLVFDTQGFYEYSTSKKTFRRIEFDENNISNPINIAGADFSIRKDRVLQDIYLYNYPLKENFFLTEFSLKKDSMVYFFNQTTVMKTDGKTAEFVAELDGKVNTLFDYQGQLMAATEKGIINFSQKDNLPILPDVKFTYVFKSTDGIVWATSLNAGIFSFPLLSFNNKKIQFQDYNDLNTGKITSLKAVSNKLIIGTSEEKIYQYSDVGMRQVIDKVYHRPERLSILQIDVRGDEFYTTGQFKYRLINNNFTPQRIHHHSAGINFPLRGGKIICTGYSPGYIVFGGAKDSVNVETENERLICVDQDENGVVWFGGLHGLWFASENNLTKPQRFTEYQPLKTRINNVVHSKQNVIVFGTSANGLILKKGNDYMILNQESGLNSNFINSLEFENDSILWAGTNKGISKILLKPSISQSKVLFSMNTDDGLKSNFINALTVWNDELWMGTDKGLQYFNLKNLVPTNVAPRLNLERIIVAQQDSFTFSDNVFQYYQNDISIQFVGICFKKPVGEFYKYRLIVDGDTSTAFTFTNNTQVDFFNLLPGKYRFEVLCRNKNDLWSEAKVYNFTIVPHFSDTLWFKLLMTFIGLVIAGIVIYWQYREIKSKNEKLNQIRELQFKFKDSELATLRSQMNPHFVFNALNSIQSYILDNNTKIAANYVQRFSSLMRAGLEYSRSEYIALNKEMSFLDNYLTIEQLRFPDRFTFKIELLGDYDAEDYLVPPLLIQPIVENSVKHAFKPDETNGKILITFEPRENYVLCTVTDNGVGINSGGTTRKVKHRSLGIEVVKNRLELLGNEHFKPSINYTDLSEENENITGTKVEVTLPIG
ncbi:MAG: histidine kinase [Bacteroidia bacterium]